MRRVLRAGAEIHEERLFRRDLARVGDEADRLVDEVFGQMIALLRRLRRFDLVIVVDQIGVILAGVAGEEAIVALEAAPERPTVVGSGGADLLGRGQMPFAERVGAVTLLQQNLRQHAVLERNRAVRPGKALGAFGDAGHGIGMVVASGDHARARGRAQRRGVHAGEQQTALGELVEIGGGDRRAVAAKLAKAGVVEDDIEDVRRARLGALGLRPGRLGFADCAAHDSGKGCAFVFLQRHWNSPRTR